MPDLDVTGAIEALLAMADRTPGFPSGDVVVHPDELLAVVEKLTAPSPVGCGCLYIKDDEGVSSLISNICTIHKAERPADFYGDGFWAGYMQENLGDSIDPDTLTTDERERWFDGYAAGSAASQPFAPDPEFRVR